MSLGTKLIARARMGCWGGPIGNAGSAIPRRSGKPSSGLDSITASEIDGLLLKVKEERHTTMVIVTHDIRGVRKIADKVAVLEEGAFVEFGSFSELEIISK